MGLTVEILNDTSTTIKVYPYSGETIDGGTADAAVNLAGKHSLKLVCTSSSNWVRLTPNIIYDSSGTRLN